MLQTVVSFSLLLRSIKEMCPECNAPIVATKPIFLLFIFNPFKKWFSSVAAFITIIILKNN
jgi:hypothetical protein